MDLDRAMESHPLPPAASRWPALHDLGWDPGREATFASLGFVPPFRIK